MTTMPCMIPLSCTSAQDLVPQNASSWSFCCKFTGLPAIPSAWSLFPLKPSGLTLSLPLNMYSNGDLLWPHVWPLFTCLTYSNFFNLFQLLSPPLCSLYFFPALCPLKIQISSLFSLWSSFSHQKASSTRKGIWLILFCRA